MEFIQTILWKFTLRNLLCRVKITGKRFITYAFNLFHTAQSLFI